MRLADPRRRTPSAVASRWPSLEPARATGATYRLAGLEASRINFVRIATDDQFVEMPWETSRELRGRLLAAGLDTLDNQFADKGTSVPIILDQADKEALLPVLSTWIEQIGDEQAVAREGLLALRDALQADLAEPHPG
jgi:hypothetical protein